MASVHLLAKTAEDVNVDPCRVGNEATSWFALSVLAVMLRKRSHHLLKCTYVGSQTESTGGFLG